MAVTKFEICSRALNTIGFGSINSFNDDNQRALICGDVWDTFSRYLLSIYPWYFIQKKAQLGRLATAPVNEYQYAYQLPGDLLRLNAIYASGDAGAIPIQNYNLVGNRVLGDDSSLWADYQEYVIAEGWPYWFVYFAIKALALELAEHIPTDDTKLAKLQVRVWGNSNDNGRGGLYGQAMNLDSKQRPAEPIRDFELISTRFV